MERRASDRERRALRDPVVRPGRGGPPESRAESQRRDSSRPPSETLTGRHAFEIEDSMGDETEIRKILGEIKTIAVVGCSKDPAKDAHRVPKYMQMNGYRIIPVNPTATEILGEKAYPSLDAVPIPYDAVDIFRPSADVPPIVEQAIPGPARVIWLQLGIRNEDAAKKARSAGKIVVQDHCMMRDHARLFGRKILD